MKNFLFTLALIFSFLSPGAQEKPERKIVLSFNAMLNGKTLVLKQGQYYYLNESDSVTLNNFKFYIGEIQLINEDKVVYQDKGQYYLMNLLDSGQNSIPLSPPQSCSFNRIRFFLGTDSLLNSAGVMGGDLDPVQGMYWIWQSGYINFKIEGNCNLSPAPRQEFIFHVGGFQSPFGTYRTLEFNCDPKEKLNVRFDLSKWIMSCGLEKRAYLMSPGINAKELSQLAANCFSIAP